ncbi:MAG: hypothetical protein SGILL_005070 [Bacillariaceae sp.]
MDYYGGGSGGRHHHRGGGRRGRGYGRGRGGRGRGHRHQPYNNSRNRNRGGRPSNRFGGNQAALDPETAMVRQISSFVSRVGEFKNIREVPEGVALRAVEATTAGNINELVGVLCSEDKIEMLFKYREQLQATPQFQPPVVKPEEKIGKLGHVLISCAAGLPLQTASYAALTLAVHEQTKESPWKGFAHRCAGYAMYNISKDLDEILGTGKNISQPACRIKLLLRYLAVLGRVGVVQGFQSEQAADPTKLTIFGLLSTMVEAAKAAQQRNALVVSYLLAQLVLSTLPYLMEYVPQESIDEWILKPLKELLAGYSSSFTPGTGRTAILLKGEQDDGDSNDDDEEDEDDEDDDEEGSGPICDSLQDLLRVAEKFREPTRFALPIDSPWKGLTRTTAPNPESGETEIIPVAFSEDPLYLSVGESKSLQLLLTGEGDFTLVQFSLDGVVFGRLPIFGAPPDPDNDEEEMDENAPKNESLLAFQKSMSLLDRFFVSETLRDCVMCHESFVNPTGLLHGSAKSVAEELVSIHHLFSGENPSTGMEYAIVESLFGLLSQAQEGGAVKHTSVARVLLELTRLHPQRFSPALAVAMTNLFEDYLPSLVPAARDNYCRWFSFHLINTDYQWPSAYWELWQPYALSPNQSSRGDFVRRSLQLMVENVSNPSTIEKECLSDSKTLTAEFFPRTTATYVQHAEGSPMENFEAEMNRRIWDQSEDPATLAEFLLGEEVTNALQGVEGHFLKSQAMTRVLFSPATKVHQSLKDELSVSENGDDGMMDDTAQTKDLILTVLDAIPRYGKTLQAVLIKEAETGGDVALGGALCLRHVESMAYFNASILRGAIAGLLKQSVVNGVAVARWALGDVGDAGVSYLVPRWWLYVNDALRLGTPVAEGNDGMVLDGNAAESMAKAAREGALKYAMTRACSLLATKDEKKLSPEQVDLVEGTKSIVSMAVNMQGQDGTVAPALASMCSEFGGSMAVELLKNSLEQF